MSRRPAYWLALGVVGCLALFPCRSQAAPPADVPAGFETLSGPSTWDEPSEVWLLAFRDVDQDGDIDIVGTTYLLDRVVWINEGHGRLKSPVVQVGAGRFGGGAPEWAANEFNSERHGSIQETSRPVPLSPADARPCLVGLSDAPSPGDAEPWTGRHGLPSSPRAPPLDTIRS